MCSTFDKRMRFNIMTNYLRKTKNVFCGFFLIMSSSASELLVSTSSEDDYLALCHQEVYVSVHRDKLSLTCNI